VISSARPPLDVTMMATASVWASRGTCNRLYVGAVIARGGRVLSTGYNGAARGEGHCSHPMGDIDNGLNPCTEAIHAETNAIINAAVDGVSVLEGTLYCTHAPCHVCAGLIINAAIARVVWNVEYRSVTGLRRLERAGLEVVRL
jgi:dCMP deaminase